MPDEPAPPAALSPAPITTLTRQPTNAVWEIIKSIAPAIHSSRFFGVASPEQAATIMLRGYELGLSMTTAFEVIHVIDGKPSLSPRGALALIQQSGLLEGLEITGDTQKCVVTMKRRGGFSYTQEFSIDDAKRAGLVKDGGGWTKYPQQMLKWRAIGFCADVVFPDVLAGMRRADEMGASIDITGDVIDAATGEVLS